MLVKFFDTMIDADEDGNVWIDLEENAVEIYGPMNHHGYCLKVYAKQLKDGKWLFSEDMLDHKKPSGTKIMATRWALNDADIRCYLRTLQPETCRSYDHDYTHVISFNLSR